MVRIAGVDIPEKKRIVIALTYIFGIGLSISKQILSELKINEDKKANKLSDKEMSDIQLKISKFPVEGEIRRTQGFNIKRLKEIGCYRGIRHRKGLPVRGQITQKNARTRKGPKKTVAGKKKVSR